MSARAATRGAGPDGDRTPIRVLVVDDSAICREMLVEVIRRDPRLALAGVASDGEEAVRRTVELAPDIVTMDLAMPGLDGIGATRAIMERCPTPILVITGHPFQSGRNMTFEALAAGALDLLVKPDFAEIGELDRLAEDLGPLLRFLAAIEPRRSGRTDTSGPRVRPRPIDVVAIAASAGGPGVVRQLLANLPRSFPAGIVICQHICEGFDEDFARWLDEATELDVRLAHDRDEIRAGEALVAPGEAHLRAMPGGRLRLVGAEPIAGHRPSADVLLSSIAAQHGRRSCGVVLSGMGDDGVSGLRDMRAAGALTVAQDEGSSVVWGMPGAAVQAGLVDLVLPAARIGTTLLEACKAAGAEATAG